MKGRKPKPTHLKMVTGNPGRRRLPKDEPKPKRGKPEAPTHLSPKAAEVWPLVAQWLDQMGVLTLPDAAALEQLCETYADIVRARADLNENGWYQSVITKSGDVMERARPAVSVVQDADRRLRAWLTEFGLTPSARVRVRGNGGEEEVDPLEEYLG